MVPCAARVCAKKTRPEIVACGVLLVLTQKSRGDCGRMPARSHLAPPAMAPKVNTIAIAQRIGFDVTRMRWPPSLKSRRLGEYFKLVSGYCQVRELASRK